jgi:hypothetical protein
MAEVEEKKPRRIRVPSMPKEVVEHARAASRERRAALKALIPESCWGQKKTAQKETLLALRWQSLKKSQGSDLSVSHQSLDQKAGVSPAFCIDGAQWNGVQWNWVQSHARVSTF